MGSLKKNKEFILRYINAISGVIKTREVMEQYVADQGLIEHIVFFDSAFPKYEMFIDEITAEGNRVVLRARVKAKHEGILNGIPPTHKTIEMPFSIGYEIENEKIISHWMIADQMMLMEQLGVLKQPA
ncbi:MAG: ester cyclase [Flammeovirgaceae bacterium]|jgi:predicted ester cyclase|nr:ester cyclase [Flammeovirgaceae bacterium]